MQKDQIDQVVRRREEEHGEEAQKQAEARGGYAT